jgi:hypothetical protein
MIRQIGDWVLRTACAQIKSWDEQGVHVPRVAVNLSPRQFLRGALTGAVVDVLEQSRRVLAVFSGHYHSGWYSERRGIRYIVGKGMVDNDAAHNAAGVVKIDKNLNIFIEGLEDEPSRNLTKSALSSL